MSACKYSVSRLSPWWVVAMLLLLGSCHLEAPLIGDTRGGDHLRPPSAPTTTVTGHVNTEGDVALGGASLRFFQGDGTELPGLVAAVDADGVWQLEVPGVQSYANLWAVATSGSVVGWGVVPEIPKAASVYDRPADIQVEGVLDPIDEVLTAALLILDRNLRTNGSHLANLTPRAVVSTAEDIVPLLDLDEGGEKFVVVHEMVRRLLTAAASSSADTPVFLAPDQLSEAGSRLNPAFLVANSVDYDGDEVADNDAVAFEAALGEAAGTFLIDVCLHPDLIRVVFQADFNPGTIDGNCNPINRWLWTLDEPGKTMFLVGGAFTATNKPADPVITCEDEPDYEFCATQDAVQLANEAMGDWTPNQIEMYDDGTHGDAVGGDGIYSIALDLPRGMRISYKFTWGDRGALWTGNEEWPGNERILELIDVNDDNLIVRRDNYGDETTNKTVANLRTPRHGGTGSVDWDADRDEDGLLDTREIMIDTDGDCQPDEWPSPGPVGPLTVDCPE